MMRNLCSLVATGGRLFCCAVGGTDHYVLYNAAGRANRYPVPSLHTGDFETILPELGFDPGRMTVRYQQVEGQETEGVFAVILVSAVKAKAVGS